MASNGEIKISTAGLQDDLLLSLCRGLKEDNKFARKSSILKIRTNLDERSSEDVSHAFEVVFKEVLRLFEDPSEACREQAILLISDFILKVPSAEPYLTFIITVLAKRIGSEDKSEPAEEIRLLSIKCLSATLTKSSDCNLPLHLDDLTKILCNGLLDNFPDAKMASCECTKLLVQTIPKKFHVQSETFLKALIPGAVHKHSKVRAAFISTIGIVVKYGTHNLIEKVAQVLGERLYDSSPAVRKEVISVGGDWLVTLPDRYSQFCRIIPLVVTGLDDEMPEVQEVANDKWSQAGQQFELENEEELKNELDYGLASLPNYPLDVPRPSVGCRQLMKKDSHKMIPAILREMHDWNNGVRMQAASLLYQLVRHLEAKNIQYLQKLWPDLSLKCADTSDPQLKQKSDATATLLGFFAPPDALLPVALPQDELTRSQLCCLSASLKGFSTLEESHLLTVCRALANSNNTNMELVYQHALLECASETLNAIQRLEMGPSKIRRESSLALFSVLLNLIGNSQSAQLSTNSKDLLEKLAVVSEISTTQLFELHGADTLSTIPSTVSVWTEQCAHRNIFTAFVHGAGNGIGPVLPTVADILVSWGKTASTGADLADMLKVSMPILSWKFLRSCNIDPEPFLKTILFEVIQPNLKWSAGRVAEARRSQALVLLTIVISESEVSDEIFTSLMPNFPPLLTSMLEETAKDPRLGAGRVLEIVCIRWRKLGLLDIDTTFKIVKVAADRLDDVKADVRLQALQVLKAALPNEIPPAYSSHLEHLFKTILIHLDDQDKNYSAAVLETLKVIGARHVEMVTKLLDICRKHFTDQEICDNLMRHLQSI